MKTCQIEKREENEKKIYAKTEKSDVLEILSNKYFLNKVLGAILVVVFFNLGWGFCRPSHLQT